MSDQLQRRSDEHQFTSVRKSSKSDLSDCIRMKFDKKILDYELPVVLECILVTECERKELHKNF